MQRSVGIAVAFVVMTAAQAGAQTQLPLPASPFAMLLPAPLPPGGCVWASRTFSEGAEFCFAPRVILKCSNGKWSYDTLDACNGLTAPVDTR